MKFNNIASFDKAKFNNIAKFSLAIFNDTANFRGMNFNDFADFRRVNFKATAYFSGTKFNNVNQFTGPERLEKLLLDKNNFQKFYKYYNDQGRYADADIVYYNYRQSKLEKEKWNDPDYWWDFYLGSPVVSG